jgi:prenylcysteine alpha-carboxyl methylesterase
MLSASALLDGLARRLPAELRKSLRIDPLYKDDFEHTDEDSERYPSFPPPSSFIGISGPYNLPLHGLKFLEKGLDRRIVLDIFHNDLRGFSPLHRANAISKLFKLRGSDHIREDPELRSWLDIPVLLLHGTNDHSVPSSSSTSFASSLSQIFPNVSTKLYEGKTHTDPIIEDPFEGGEGVGADVCDWILGHSKTDGVGCVDVGKAAEKERRRVPAFLVRWARWWNPF